MVGTFSYDLTLSASDISDRTAVIHHQNLESECQIYIFFYRLNVCQKDNIAFV